MPELRRPRFVDDEAAVPSLLALGEEFSRHGVSSSEGFGCTQGSPKALRAAHVRHPGATLHSPYYSQSKGTAIIPGYVMWISAPLAGPPPAA